MQSTRRCLTIAMLSAILTLNVLVKPNIITMKPSECGTLQVSYTQISILYVETSKNFIGYGYPMYITVFVENGGDTAEIFKLTTYCNSKLLEEDTLSLAAGSNVKINFSWVPSSGEVGKYTIWASTTPFLDFCIGNQVFVSIPGDINGDCKVDMKDIGAIAKAFGSYIGYPRYNPNYDINCDGKIDMKDISIAAKNFGKSWSIPRNVVTISATSPHIANGEDASTVSITIINESGSPVPGANMIVFAYAKRDWEKAYLVEEIGGGAYVSHIVSSCTGNYTLVSYDPFGNDDETFAIFAPSITTTLHLEVTYDPIGIVPKAILEAYATDDYANVVEDANITFTTDLGTITSIYEDFPGVYTATLIPNGWGTANITAADTNSGVFNTTQVEFSAAYLKVHKYPQLYGNFTAAVYVYAPAKHGYLDFYSMKIFFDNKAVNLPKTTDGNTTDGFLAPNVTVIDESTIMIFQKNNLQKSTENVWVANLTFYAALPGPFTIGILPPEVYVKTIIETVPYAWFLPVPKPVLVKTGVVLEIKLKYWRLLDQTGKPIDSDEAIEEDKKKAQDAFDKAWNSCEATGFILVFKAEINNITWAEFKAIDDCDNKLDANERKKLFEKYNRADVVVNIYYGFPIKEGDIGRSRVTPGSGGGLFGGGIIIDNAKDFDDLTLWHELLHYLSRNQIKDDRNDPGNKQGSRDPGNAMNNGQLGPNISKWQGSELAKKLQKYYPNP